MTEKPLILFGAGNHGHQALLHYGAENVAFFCDNAPEKTGRACQGKAILSFGQMLAQAAGYQVVVCSAESEAMASQLEAHGVRDYLVYSPLPLYERLPAAIRALQERPFVLYGVDSQTRQLLAVLRAEGLLCHVSALADREGSAHIGSILQGFTVCPLSSIPADANCFVIASRQRSKALALALGQRFGPGATILNPFHSLLFYNTDEVVVDTYALRSRTTSEAHRNAMAGRTASLIRPDMDAYVETAMRGIPLFSSIEIETINRCNGVCDFCPVNRHDDPREKLVMSDVLFHGIIAQLKELDYRGSVALYSNNEPLLDDRLVDFHRHMRRELPRAHLFLFTNGTLLTLDLFQALMECLDELIIDNYSEDLRLLKPCREVLEYVEAHRPELRSKVSIVLRDPRERLSSRGGDAPNRLDRRSYGDMTCALPFQQMIVRPDGKISLCCNDPLGRCTLGDLSRQTLTEAWYGEAFQAVRRAIAQGRKHHWHCEYCDFFRV